MKDSTRLALGGVVLLAASCGEAGDVSEESVETVIGELTAGQITGGEYLFQGQRLNASQCYYNLRMQTDGNLVAYAGQGANAIWATHTEGTQPSETAYAAFQSDGNLVVRTATGHALWASGTDRSGTRLRMQNDGNLVVYNSLNNAVWASHSEGESLGTSCSSVKPTEVMQVLANADRPGGDLPRMPLRFPYHAQCGNACAQRASCKAYTFVASEWECWLKDSVPPVVFRSGMNSGAKAGL